MNRCLIALGAKADRDHAIGWTDAYEAEVQAKAAALKKKDWSIHGPHKAIAP